MRMSADAASEVPTGRGGQSGLLTAGDYDDLLNPESYARYARRFLADNPEAQLPFIDTRSRVAIRVVDEAGRAVPFARVSATRPGAPPLGLVTAADGVASLFPGFDRLGGSTAIEVASPAGTARRTLSPAQVPPGREIVIPLSGAAPAVRRMDLLLAIDTTGSMGDELAFLQTELDAIVVRLRRTAPGIDLRIGLIVYRDEGDDYVVRSVPFTADAGALRRALAAQEATGGGDYPEAVDRAFAAAEQFGWRADAVQAMLFVADAPPHLEGAAPVMASVARLRARGVQIVPLAASGVAAEAEYMMRSMAALTQARYLFLTDDSGVGNAHAEPEVACYVVTRLDGLVGRVLAALLSGRRIEPAPGEVIRRVGDYRAGRCDTQ